MKTIHCGGVLKIEVQGMNELEPECQSVFQLSLKQMLRVTLGVLLEWGLPCGHCAYVTCTTVSTTPNLLLMLSVGGEDFCDQQPLCIVNDSWRGAWGDLSFAEVLKKEVVSYYRHCPHPAVSVLPSADWLEDRLSVMELCNEFLL
ncbi:hypothetical protein [Equine adenovirus 2]|uniref:Uncharacterized protein n=1 Tax=Equine adenovirus B serotype 2 TaxID=67603 RepID=A0A0K1DBV3_ADEE2|nr:hypothetical protein [Equine adenovirus 2]AKT26045.1 hypothetical protein [Equine adenovirus 2]